MGVLGGSKKFNLQVRAKRTLCVVMPITRLSEQNYNVKLVNKFLKCSKVQVQ
jgi:hypothetical protein